MAGTIRLLRTNFLESTAAALLNGPAVALGVICQWTNGSATVTRASGSFIADGVKKWSLVSGNLAAKFPANVRVQSLAADGLSLTLTATATAVGSGTDSGTFTPNAALDEASGYPMSNVMNGKRYAGWKSAAPPASTVYLEFDLGSSKTPACLCVLAHEDGAVGTVGGAAFVGIDYATTYSGAVPTWNAIGTWVVQSYRDRFLEFSPTAARFWRFAFTPSSVSGVNQQFGAGGLWLGALDSDMLTYGWPGSSRVQRKNRARLEAGGRAVHFIRTGHDVTEFAPLFEVLTDADFAKLSGAFGDRPPILIDHLDRAFEVEFGDDALPWGAVFTGLQRSAPLLRSLP